MQILVGSTRRTSRSTEGDYAPIPAATSLGNAGLPCRSKHHCLLTQLCPEVCWHDSGGVSLKKCQPCPQLHVFLMQHQTFITVFVPTFVYLGKKNPATANQMRTFVWAASCLHEGNAYHASLWARWHPCSSHQVSGNPVKKKTGRNIQRHSARRMNTS